MRSGGAEAFGVLAVVLGFCAQMFLTDCPSLCECKWKSGKESVVCLKANLSVVPLHLDAGTQILDLTSNNLATVRHDEFSEAGLLNLQKIFISKCRLRSIDRYAFRHLINLVELDLSYNALNSIPSHTFDSIPELRELKLNGNPIQRIPNEAFIHVPQLVRLEISDCKIASVEDDAFHGLDRSLEWLKLDKNKLSDVSPTSLTVLQNLHGLEVAGNPWNCSCGLRPLREWMLRKNVPFGVPPVCNHPKRLQGKPWDKLELDEFACVPEIFAYDSTAHGIEGKNVTMTCRITGIPEPNVRWLLKNKVIANLSGTPYSNGKKLYVVHLQNSSSDLTILTADLQDAGIYVCAAENKAGRVEASVTLAVSRKPADGPLSNKILFASVVAGILFVLATCLISLCILTIRKKHLNRWPNRACRSEDDYEKIEMNRKVSENANGRPGEGLAVVRKNGDYRVVPGADTDQELEDEEEVKETKFEDLHIPKQNREDSLRSPSSTCGTYNYEQPSTSSGCQQQQQQRRLKDTATFSTDLASLLEGDEKKFPDLIENSPNKSNNNFCPTKANSEGGSVSDINELFCTLPRKRTLVHNSRYLSTDSQTPLLPESRYGSSGGESISSRRLSSDKGGPNLNKNRMNQQRSNSFLNLPQMNSSTPLLDIQSLENRVTYTPNPGIPNSNMNAYDYHAAQLERFLEEYRTLQKELTRMKESCDNMRQDKYLDNASPQTPKDEEPRKTSPNSNTLTVGNFESDLTRYLLKSSPKAINNSTLFNS
ncbi:PREDICTED: uncharacterized protein LOC108557392 [Nicrophorus vespilloides]|uniref:Uncharacterized protein LOC108557392 n=1 Tax=Nicrophorus vespilloides TaxID=110193 RepID=A0ABM1M474_NICVS|nr:PREDICTED: uncharacterized protein LOC108557392 [Nicrophorus vespilloides]